MWIYVFISLKVCVYLGVELLGHIVTMFVLRTCQTVFHNGGTILHNSVQEFLFVYILKNTYFHLF